MPKKSYLGALNVRLSGLILSRKRSITGLRALEFIHWLNLNIDLTVWEPRRYLVIDGVFFVLDDVYCAFVATFTLAA